MYTVQRYAHEDRISKEVISQNLKIDSPSCKIGESRSDWLHRMRDNRVIRPVIFYGEDPRSFNLLTSTDDSVAYS